MKLTHILILGASAAVTVAMAGCYINTTAQQPPAQPAASAQPTAPAQPAVQQPAQTAQPVQTAKPAEKKPIPKWGSKANKPAASSSAAPANENRAPTDVRNITLTK